MNFQAFLMSKNFMNVKVLTLIFCTFLACGEKDHTKKSVTFKGYKEGTLFDAYIIGYDDFTYYFSNADSKSNCIWVKKRDTVVLMQNNVMQAILVNFIPIKIYNSRYDWLRDMKFIEKNKPKNNYSPNFE